MYRKLTVDFSLFVIDEKMLAEFLVQVKQYVGIELELKQQNIKAIDQWGIILNLWLLGEKEGHYRVLKPDMELYYSADALFLRLLDRNELYHKYIDNADARQRFVFAFCIGRKISKWVLAQFSEEDQLKLVFHESSGQPYYQLSSEEILREGEVYMASQTMIMRKILEQFGDETAINKFIRDSALDTKMLPLTNV